MGLRPQLRLGVLFQMYVVVGRFHFLAAVELMGTCFFKVSRGISRFYFRSFICLGPSCRGSSSLSLRINKLRSLTTSAKSVHPGLLIEPHHGCRTFMTPAQSQVCPASKRGLYRLCIRRGSFLDHQNSATNFPPLPSKYTALSTWINYSSCYCN